MLYNYRLYKIIYSPHKIVNIYMNYSKMALGKWGRKWGYGKIQRLFLVSVIYNQSITPLNCMLSSSTQLPEISNKQLIFYIFAALFAIYILYLFSTNFFLLPQLQYYNSMYAYPFN